MVVSATFNISDLTPYVGDCFNDPSDLMSNPLKKGTLMRARHPREFAKFKSYPGYQSTLGTPR